MPNLLRSLPLALVLATLALCGTTASARTQRVTAPAPVGIPDKAAPEPRSAKRSKRTLGERAARIALRAVGVPYRWAGTSPASGFDCSGLIYWAYGKLGVEVPHSSYALAGIGRRIGRGHLKPGDVLVFSGYGHAGLYIGRGRMVHAPRSGRLVEVVRLGASGYGGRIVAARRITRR